MRYGNSRKYMKNLLAGSMSVALAASMVTMAIPVTAFAADGFESAAEQNVLKKVDVNWTVDFSSIDDNYFTDYFSLSSNEKDEVEQYAALPSEWLSVITKVTVNGVEKKNDGVGTLFDNDKFKQDRNGKTISIGGKDFADGDNTVVISAEGYEDVVLAVTFDSEAKTASLKTVDADEIAKADPITLSNGTYHFEASLYKTGTTEASGVASYIDKSVRIAKTDEGYELSVLIPTGGEGHYSGMASMISGLSVKDASGNEVTGKKSSIKNVGIEYTFQAESFTTVTPLTFKLSGVGAHSGSAPAADLALTQVSNWWAGYASQAPTNLADGMYRMKITTMLAQTKSEGDPTVFETPTMGDNVLGDYVWIQVKDGKHTAIFNTEPVMGINLYNFRYYSKSGDYRDDSNAENALKSAQSLTRVRAEDGSILAGVFSDVISINLAGKGADPYAFLRTEIREGTSTMPYPEVVAGGVWTALMDWSSLEEVDATVPAALQSAVSAAEKVASNSSIEKLNDAATWKAFKNRLAAAQDGARVSYALSAAEINMLATNLTQAQTKLKTVAASKKAVKTVTVNTGTVTAATVKAAVKKAGATAKSTTTIVLGDKVKTIKANAFKGYNSLSSVTLGKNVKTIKANAFKGSSVKTVTVKTTKLAKKSVKNCLKGSKVKTVKVAVGSAKANKKTVKAYKKIFTKKISGKSVTVK